MTLEAVRTDLASAHFTVDGLRALWGDSADAALARGERTAALRVLGPKPDPLAVLARVFLLGVPVTAHVLESALPTAGVDGVRELGMLEPADPGSGTLRAAHELRPYDFVDSMGAGSWWIASDFGEAARPSCRGTANTLTCDHARVRSPSVSVTQDA